MNSSGNSDFKFLLLIRLYLKRRKGKDYMRKFLEQRSHRGDYRMQIPDLIQDSEIFFNYFRMTKRRFQCLERLVCPLIEHKKTHRLPIGSRERLCLVLRILASGESQASTAIAYRISKASVSIIVKETCAAIYTALHTTYLPVPTKSRFGEVCEDFWKLWQFPNCLGAIDGKHVEVTAPPNTGSLNFNYKKYFSVQLMAISDARYVFTFVDIGAPGSCSDSTIFSNSSFGKLINEKKLDVPDKRFLPETSMKLPCVFIGDAGFPLTDNIMRPYPSQNDSDENLIFNYRLSRARRTVENAFGVLSAKWRILRSPIEAHTAVNDIIMACICLHNYLRITDFKEEKGRQYIQNHTVDQEDENNSIIPGEWRNEVLNASFGSRRLMFSNNYTDSASDIRDNLRNFFLTEAGQLSWQRKAAHCRT